MNDRQKVHAICISLIVLAIIASFILGGSQPGILRVSLFGVLALLSLLFVIALPLIAKQTKSQIAFHALAQRRWIGIYTFIFAAIHVLSVLIYIYDWQLPSLLQFTLSDLLAGGLVGFAILAVMAAISNNYSMKVLGANWKRIQMLVYVALLFVLYHFISNGLIFAQNKIFVAAVFIIAAAIIIVRFYPKKKPVAAPPPPSQSVAASVSLPTQPAAELSPPSAPPEAKPPSA
jgi:DMSO/TMAO reductase YedYZ heme-binding membrane subunit